MEELALGKFYKDRQLAEELKTKLNLMFENATHIRNHCSNSPDDFRIIVESDVVKERVAWFGAHMRATLAQVYSPSNTNFHKPNHDIALLLIIMAGRWRAHAKKSMQAHLNVTEITNVMEELGMTSNLVGARLKELEEMDWINRIESFSDRRIKLVIPTETLINRQLTNIALEHLIKTASMPAIEKHMSKHIWGVMGYDMDLWHWVMKTFSYYSWGKQLKVENVEEVNEMELFNIHS
jgi:hypothetical protein